MKKVLLTLLVFGLLIFAPAVQAKGGQSYQNNKQQVIAKSQSLLVKEIEKRVSGLKKLIEKAGRLEMIAKTQKEGFLMQIQKEIDALEAIIVTLKNETDPEKIRELRRQVNTSYRVYSILVPRLNLIAYGDKLLVIAAKIEAFKGATDEVKTKVSEARSEILSGLNMVISVTPTGYPENKAILHEAKQKLVGARKLLNIARSTIKNEK